MGQQELSGVLETLKFLQHRKDTAINQKVEQAKFEAERDARIEQLRQEKEKYTHASDLALKTLAMHKSVTNALNISAQHELANSSFKGGNPPGENTVVPGVPMPRQDSAPLEIQPPQEGNNLENSNFGAPAPPQISPTQGLPNLAPPNQQLGSPTQQVMSYRNPNLQNAEGQELAPVTMRGTPESNVQQQANFGEIANQPKNSFELLKEHGANLLAAQKEQSAEKIRQSAQDAMERMNDKKIAGSNANALIAANSRKYVADKNAAVRLAGKGGVQLDPKTIESLSQQAFSGQLSADEYYTQAKAVGLSKEDTAKLLGPIIQAGGLVQKKEKGQLQAISKVSAAMPDVVKLNDLINANPYLVKMGVGELAGSDAYKQAQAILKRIDATLPNMSQMEGNSGRITMQQMEKVKGLITPGSGTFGTDAHSRQIQLAELANTLQTQLKATLGNRTAAQEHAILENYAINPGLNALHQAIANAGKLTPNSGIAAPTSDVVRIPWKD